MKEWQISRAEYAKMKAEYFNAEHTVSEWVDFSMKPQSMKDIMFRAIMTAFAERDTFTREENDTQHLCFSYMCEHSYMAEDFIDDLLYVNSGLFDFEWNDNARAFVLEILKQGRQYNCINDLEMAILGAGELPHMFRESCNQKVSKAYEYNLFKISNLSTRIGQLYRNKTELVDELSALERAKFYSKVDRRKFSIPLVKTNDARLKEIPVLIKGINKEIEVGNKQLDKMISDRNSVKINLAERLDFNAIQKNKQITLSKEWKKSHEKFFEGGDESIVQV